jgi:formylmethanofuran dehydrogenase subunit B
MDHQQAHLATCLGCGCTCDDIEAVVRDGRIVETRLACPLGAAWFGDGVAPARVLVGGREVTLEAALEAVAAMLGAADRPMIGLALDIPCEAQREAVALADGLRGAIDSVLSTTLPATLAAQVRGRASATLGEVRNRADVVVFWGVDPDAQYPRFRTRYAPDVAGRHVSEGRRSRRVVSVDVGESRGPADADRRVEVPPGDEVSTLIALAARLAALGPQETIGPAGEAPAVTGTTVTATATSASAVDDSEARPDEVSAGAVPSPAWQRADRLAGALAGGRYVVIVAEAEDRADRDPGRHGALLAFVQALNGPTRAALSLLRRGGNAPGGEAVLTWQTGYPAAVDFARGVPRYRPLDGTLMARLGRGDLDALLVIGAMDGAAAEWINALGQVPSAVIGPRASESPLSGAHVRIDTGVAGIHEAGLAVRMDEVPLPLRRLLDGPPATAGVVRALRDRCTR